MGILNGYVAPLVRIIEVEVEKGFAASYGEGEDMGGGDN